MGSGLCSFATHLVENDVDIDYIQAMLGHKSPLSTSVYVHVSNKTLMGITSPLDKPKDCDDSKDGGKGNV